MLKHASKKKLWRINGVGDSDASREIAAELGLSAPVGRLLASRGHESAEAARRFINKETELLHDPFLLKDMDKAADRVLQAVQNNEKTVVYGDYDVDGVTSVTVVYSYLKELGADVSYYIPSRIGEGYGVNIDAVRTFAGDGVRLMITVDTGITATDEVKAAAELSLDVVITDHHECRPELPEAVAVVNPKRPDCPYPFKELAGVGVAFKLICALEMKRRECSLYDAVSHCASRFCDTVAIGTIADVMPLVDENRIIVSHGLSMLENTKNIGLNALMRASGLIAFDADGNRIKKKMTSASVGFTLAPRINAAGRIASAEYALELFITDSEARAEEIAEGLCETNKLRQAEENSIIEAAESKLSEQCSEDDYIIILDDDHWHHGVIGIVCSRLTEKYNLPSILISFENNTVGEPSPSDLGKGSGRSIEGLNLFEALEACSEHLFKYGGHELAAGLSVERGKLADFRAAINAFASRVLGDTELCRTVDIDGRIYPEEIGAKLVNELHLLEPFGTGNPQPIFETDRLIISEIVPLANGKHTKLTLRAAGLPTLFTALCFGSATVDFPFGVGDAVDLAYNLDINEFRGRQSVQLLVRDIRRSLVPLIPDRDVFATVYKHIKSEPMPPLKVTITELSEALSLDTDTLSAVLDIFAELSMVRLYRGSRFEITVLPVTRKTPLETSRIYNSILRQ